MSHKNDAALPRSFRLARNFRWSLLGQAAGIVVGLLATPTLVRHLGVERYGLYILLQTASSYMLLLTFGAGAAAVRYIAALRASADNRGVLKAVRYALFFHGPTVLAGGALLALAAHPVLVRIFRVPEHLLEVGAFMLAFAAAGAFFSSLTQAVACMMQGLQRFDAQSTINFLQGTPTTVGAAILAASGFGIRSIAAWYALWNAIVATLSLVWGATLLRREVSDRGPGRLHLRDFAGWGLGQWLGQLAWIVSNQFDRVFAARYTTLTGLTLYSVPVGLLQRLQIIPATFSTVTAPMMSELRACGDEKGLQRLYLRSMRLLFAIGLPTLVLIFCLLPQFLSLWLGGDFGDRAVWPARLQVLAQFFILLVMLPNTAVFAVGRAWHLPVLTWAQAALSVAAWTLLARRWGLIGIAGGALLAQALPALFYVPFIHRRVVGIDNDRFLREGLLVPGAAATILLAFVFPLHAWASSWPRLFLLSAGSIALHAGACWILSPREDRETIRRYLHWETRRS